MTTPAPIDPVEAAARWYARVRADAPMDAEEAARLDAWIQADVANGPAWDRLGRLDAALGAVADDPAIAAQRAAALDAGAAPRRRAGLGRLAVAAALVAGAGTATIVGIEATNAPHAAPATTLYATAPGEIRTIALADGTRMTLDARSTARVSPPAATRRVSVDAGRAMFAVAKDKAHPFVVTIAGTSVTALGTHFSVERRGATTVVALTEGSVRVATPAGARTLVPGEVLTAGAGGLRVGGGAANESAWVDGRLFFAAVPLGEVVATLNRYGPRIVVIRDPALAARPYSGVLRATGGGDALVAALTATGAARVSARDDASVTLTAR